MSQPTPAAATCLRCDKELSSSLSFAFSPPRRRTTSISGSPASEGTVKCLACALLHPPLLKRSASASLVVGTILTLLNQGDLLLSAQWTNALFWKIPLTYCVPFLVATYGALSNSRR